MREEKRISSHSGNNVEIEGKPICQYRGTDIEFSLLSQHVKQQQQLCRILGGEDLVAT